MKNLADELAQNEVKNSNCNDVDLPPGNLPGSKAPDEMLAPNPRRRKRREKFAKAAVGANESLSAPAQETLIKFHLAEGWGKLAHGITRQLKSPGRHGLKLVDVALIITIYDQTIAMVAPRAYAPISASDFALETGMDPANIRIALNSLVSRGVLLKHKAEQVNFWGLNPAYFSGKHQDRLPPGHAPRGELPARDAPGVEQGNLPGSEGGQTTRGQSGETPENQNENPAPKNLLKESKKESSQSNQAPAEIYPNEIRERWMKLDLVGKKSFAIREREAFNQLYSTHGVVFYENCVQVIQFLESQGSGKPGALGKVHHPMTYLVGHWEHNFSRYRDWVQQVEAEERKLAQKTVQEQAKIEAAKQVQSQEVQQDNDLKRLLRIYSTETSLMGFVEQAIGYSPCDVTRKSWRTQGWESPLVRSWALSYFLEHETKLESMHEQSTNCA